ncbi:MAG: TonB-dependent receptor [Bacteroides sp.]|nr:TonB-dependent receptor [Bacteroides sp.]
MKQTVVTFCLMFLSLFVGAQEVVKIGGVVRNESGNPIELAVVRLEDTAIGTATNLKGRYSLKFEPRDSVTVVCSMLGYQTRKKLLLNPRGNISLNFTLSPLDFELGEVSITERRRQTGSTQQLDATSGTLMPDASGGGVESLLSTQAGVSNNHELSSQYNVRGGSFDENMVYVEGIEVYRPLLIRSGEQEGLSFVNPSLTHAIGFSTGGYEAKYGDKMASVLDITYKRPQQTEGSVALSLLGASLYAGFGNKHLSWINGFRYKTNRYLLGTLDTDGEYNPRFIDYQTFLHWHPSQQWEAGFIGNISENRYEFLPEDRYTRFGTLSDVREFKVYFTGQEKDLFRTFFGAGHLTYKPTPQHSITLQASAFRTQERETYDITGQYWLSALDGDSEEEAETTGIGTYLEHARNRLTADVLALALKGNSRLKQHNLQWGVELKRERIREKTREWEMRDSAGYAMPQQPDASEVAYVLTSDSRMSSLRYSFYLQDSYKFQNRAGLFTLTAGVRGSYWDWNQEFIFSPRASLALIPTFNDRFTLRVAAGLYYQAPFYKEVRDTTQTGGVATVCLNQDIRSQQSLHLVAGGDYHFRAWNRPFRFSMELYYKALRNLIPYNVDNVRISYYGRNLAKGYAAGVDLKLFGEFVPGTDSWLSLSLMKTEEKLGKQWLPRPTDQRYRLSLYLTDYFPGSERWKLSLKGTLAGGLPFGPPHSGREAALFRTPAYKRVDIGMSYSLLPPQATSRRRTLKSLWLGIDVLNLLDINNVNSYYWVTDSGNHQFAVPNYLTSRRINLRLLADF